MNNKIKNLLLAAVTCLWLMPLVIGTLSMFITKDLISTLGTSTAIYIFSIGIVSWIMGLQDQIKERIAEIKKLEERIKSLENNQQK